MHSLRPLLVIGLCTGLVLGFGGGGGAGEAESGVGRFGVLSGLVGPRAAHAAPKRVAVLRIDIQGNLAANNEDFLRRSLMDSLAAADFEVFGGLMVTQLLKQGSRLENCRQPTCYAEIARSLGVEYLVNGAITVERKNYDVTLELISGRDGKLIDKYNEPCQLCGISEVGTKLNQLVQAVRRGAEGAAATAPARYAIESRPGGAEVLVDGRAAGVTPLSVDLTTGPHKVTVRASGYEISESNVAVESGTNGVIAVDLAPAGSLGTSMRGPPRWWAWTAMAVGLAAIAGGAVALYYQGEWIRCADPPGENIAINMCNKAVVRQTELEAGLLLGGGGVLALTGATMLFLMPSEAPVASAPGSSLARGWVGGIRGRF